MVKMNSIVIAGGILLLLLMAFKDGCEKQSKESIPEGDVRIIAYQQGKKTLLDPKSPQFSDLQSKLEALLLDSGKVILAFKLPPQTPEEIKDTETSIEIAYPEPKNFQVPYYTGGLDVSQLLFPLSGKCVITRESDNYKNVVTFILYPDAPKYIMGPIAVCSPDEIEGILNRLR